MRWLASFFRGKGYDAQDIADLVVWKTAQLKSKRLTDVIPETMLQPTLRAVQMAGDCVLDFGGAAGLHYMVAREAYPSRHFKWAIVEHPLMVERAKKFETDALKFFVSPEAAYAWLGNVDLLHSNGVLQYLDQPEIMLKRLIALRPQYILWMRMLLGEGQHIKKQIAPLSAHGTGVPPSGFRDRNVTHKIIIVDSNAFHVTHTNYALLWKDESSFLYGPKPPQLPSKAAV